MGHFTLFDFRSAQRECVWIGTYSLPLYYSLILYFCQRFVFDFVFPLVSCFLLFFKLWILSFIYSFGFLLFYLIILFILLFEIQSDGYIYIYIYIKNVNKGSFIGSRQTSSSHFFPNIFLGPIGLLCPCRHPERSLCQEVTITSQSTYLCLIPFIAGKR